MNSKGCAEDACATSAVDGCGFGRRGRPLCCFDNNQMARLSHTHAARLRSANPFQDAMYPSIWI